MTIVTAWTSRPNISRRCFERLVSDWWHWRLGLVSVSYVSFTTLRNTHVQEHTWQTLMLAVHDQFYQSMIVNQSKIPHQWVTDLLVAQTHEMADSDEEALMAITLLSNTHKYLQWELSETLPAFTIAGHVTPNNTLYPVTGQIPEAILFNKIHA